MITRLAPGSFFGQAKRSLELAGMTFVESLYSSGFCAPPHTHCHAFFCFVLEGISTETCDKRSQTNEPFTLVYHPPEEMHANRWYEGGGRTFHVEIQASTLNRLQERLPVLAEPARFRRNLPAHLAMQLYHEYCRMDNLSPLAIEGLALELLAAAARQTSASRAFRLPTWLNQVTDILQGRFADKLSLYDLAEAVDVCPAHLARVFRQHHGCTVGEYLRRLRVDFARRRLATSDAELIDIALSAGFSDQSHLTKTFKMHTGMTPGQFRQSCQSRKRHTTG
jgi:AraC family transcriptional regulator